MPPVAIQAYGTIVRLTVPPAEVIVVVLEDEHLIRGCPTAAEDMPSGMWIGLICTRRSRALAAFIGHPLESAVIREQRCIFGEILFQYAFGPSQRPGVIEILQRVVRIHHVPYESASLPEPFQLS